MTDTIGSICVKDELKGTEWVCGCKKCEEKK